jgi:hypothetical protein
MGYAIKNNPLFLIGGAERDRTFGLCVANVLSPEPFLPRLCTLIVMLLSGIQAQKKSLLAPIPASYVGYFLVIDCLALWVVAGKVVLRGTF